MAKFNSSPTLKTTNKSGHAAYAMRDKEKLVTQVLTSFFNEKKFYGDNSKEMQETIKSVIQTDPEFVAKLAVFARREFNMRSVSHILATYLAHEPNGKPYTRGVVKAVSLRGDDVTEIMAAYLDTFGKPIPNSLKKGIADAISNFDEYTLAKYKGEGKGVKMRDLLCLCRPTPKNEAQSAMWKRCLEGKLETPYTWETELSAKGNSKETWEKLIDSNKVGYMALLRNLRNIVNAKPHNLDKVLDHIADPVAVHRSKQLPFRFLSAYKELAGNGSKVLDTLENAVDASISNLPKLQGTTVIAVDTSGSMGSYISNKSSVRCGDIAMLFGLIANRICDNSYFFTFDTNIKQYPISSRSGILSTAVAHCNSGGATKMHLVFDTLCRRNIHADRVIIISDNQCNGGWGNKPLQSLADRYRKQTGVDTWVHAIDLQGYGTQQFHGAKTNIIAGWSEKVFDFITLAEQGEGNLEKTIANYTY